MGRDVRRLYSAVLVAWCCVVASLESCTLATEGTQSPDASRGGHHSEAGPAGGGGGVAGKGSGGVNQGGSKDAGTVIQQGGAAGTGASGGDSGSVGGAGSAGKSAGGSSGNAGAGGLAGAGAGGQTTGGSAGAGGTNQGGSAGGGGSPLSCPALPGPSLDLISTASAAFCIDHTEVTTSQYQVFLDSAPAVVVDSVCSWNQQYAPEQVNFCPQSLEMYASLHPNWPVICVDWCDAREYCRWAGKRLCGRIGGGVLGFNEAIDPTLAEWTHACTNGGQTQFPYGNAYGHGTCVDDYADGNPGDEGNGWPQDVATALPCQGSSGPLDLSGNVWEWTDACELSSIQVQSDRCRDLGGSFWDMNPALLQCASDHSGDHVRSFKNKNIGFRCCADPQ